MIRRTGRALVALAAAALCASGYFAVSAAAARDAAPASVLARGRYLVVYGSCNDCHTPGWRESDGTLAQPAWLTGSTTGFRGAWGTSYPVNLRLDFQTLPEDGWVNAVHTRGGLPPMIWHNLRVLTPADRHAIYAFVRSLGPAGSPAPAPVPPWREPSTPYIDLRVHGTSAR